MRWWRRQRQRALQAPFPEEWRALVARHVPHWHHLDGTERSLLEDVTHWLVVDKRWEAARGFLLTEEMRVVIAGQAALLTIGFGDERAFDVYDDVTAIIVHPSTVHIDGDQAGFYEGVVEEGPVPVSGLAHDHGPIVIAWDEVRRSSRDPGRGRNIVFHEFAHKLDVLDHLADGTPPLATRAAVDRWVAVCTAEYEALQRDDDPLLSSYGAVSPAEFFAVATEVFFDRPVDLEAAKPALYGVLAEFYRQDPAARVRRATPPSGTSAPPGPAR